jgi:hypothetical protein
MDFLLSLSDLSGVGYYWVSERPNRLTTAARLRGTPFSTAVRQRRRRREESLTGPRTISRISCGSRLGKFESRHLDSYDTFAELVRRPVDFAYSAACIFAGLS